MHHIIPRSRGGSDGPHNLAYICRFCHRAIHDNPARAKAYGLTDSSNVDTMDLEKE
jgi:5-methylcytosine-specific restriction endonuclease McrA